MLYPNSSPPMLAHWTAAFPLFYAAIAVPVGAWAASGEVALPRKLRWIMPTALAIGLMIVACANIQFYFFRYYADPESLRVERYKVAQRQYEEQTVQSRYMASLGPSYRVVVVGQSPYAYDPEITRYLVQGQEYIASYDPQTQSPFSATSGKGLAFLFFPRAEQYLPAMRKRYAGGREDEIRNPVGRHLFYTYVVAPRNDSE